MSSAAEDQTLPTAGAAAETQTPPTAPDTAAAETTSETKLPPLTPAEFKVYNQLAEKMDYFHDHFRKTWNMLYNACLNNKRPQGMTIKQFIDEGIMFCQYLTTHHNIEETYMFPMLARKMPEFRGGSAELLQQHKQIHHGLDVFDDYLKQCRAREVELSLSVLKEKMDTWGEVLWTHLDQEVKTLGAENMRKYWTMEEVKRLPI